MQKLVSVIIPVYNEEKSLESCLSSLINQNYKQIEIIVVDDGSADKSLEIAKKFNIETFKQDHMGPGCARNLGARNAKGEILVFVDADMSFDRNFIKDLTVPILKGKTVGTFSKNEMNRNKENLFSRFWNINRGWPVERLIPPNYPNLSPVFRAILKSEFDSVEGFETTGEYTDDWSLSKKLNKKASLAKGAIYYHSNPENLKEVWQQARWIGKNSFLSGNLLRKFRSLIRFSPLFSIALGLYKSIILGFDFRFLAFKILYDYAVWLSVLKSFFHEAKYK